MTRRQRTIDYLAGGPDKRATDLNNALYVIVEFVSPRRLATLATVPTAAQLIAAVDLYLTCENNPELSAHAQALRTAAETWIEGEEVPGSVHTAAKAILTLLGPEPPRGWDADDGYYFPEAASGAEPRPHLDIPERDARVSERDAQTSERAARAAQTMMHTLNLAALLASPRVLQKAATMPTHVLEHIDTLVEVLSAGGLSSPSADIAATREAAVRLRAACAEWIPGPEAPAEVQQAARALLTALGLTEPPGGWDAFEGVEDA
jgi:hypothetical protein